jgi:hypothetical protein
MIPGLLRPHKKLLKASLFFALAFICVPSFLSSPAQEAVERFVDVADQVGIKFEHAFDQDKRYIPESMSGGIAMLDYNNDGCMDVFFTNAPTISKNDPQTAPNALYRNNCDGTFTDVTEKSGLKYTGWAMGVAVGDYDGDGFQDLYVTCLGSNHLFHNNGGDGSFSDVTAKAGVDDKRWSMGAVFFDYDKDGWLDLFVANYVDFKVEDLPKFGQGKFCQYRGAPVQCGPRGLPGAGDILFHNNGDGTFTNVTEKAGVTDPEGRYGLSVLAFDADVDGWPDLYVANDAGPNYLYHNKKDGTFEEIGFLAGVAVGEDGNEQGSMGIGLGDYLHTGKLALFVDNFADEYDVLYRHDEPLLFTDVTFAAGIGKHMGPYVSWSNAFFDYDNDGWKDLLIVNGHVYPQVESLEGSGAKYLQRMLLFHNKGNGTFDEVAAVNGKTLMVRRVLRGVAFGDYDNDGFVDAIINSQDGKALVLRNMGIEKNNWLSVKLLAPGHNRDAIGARLKVVSGDLVQWDEVFTGGSYISQIDFRKHFGLGSRTKVDEIEIHWPDGKVESVKDVAANQFLTMEEGKGITKATPPRKP